MAATYNTIPAGDASDSQTLLPSKPKTSTKFIGFAAAVASFALGAVCNVAVSHWAHNRIDGGSIVHDGRGERSPRWIERRSPSV